MAMQLQPTDTPISTYSFVMGKGQGGRPVVMCFKSPAADQHVSSFHQAAVLSEFHDESLAAATKEITAILERVKASNGNKDRELAILNVGGRGFFLVWTENAISALDDYDVLVDALGLEPLPPHS
jgi:hypothetical protein